MAEHKERYVWLLRSKEIASQTAFGKALLTISKFTNLRRWLIRPLERPLQRRRCN